METLESSTLHQSKAETLEFLWKPSHLKIYSCTKILKDYLQSFMFIVLSSFNSAQHSTVPDIATRTYFMTTTYVNSSAWWPYIIECFQLSYWINFHVWATSLRIKFLLRWAISQLLLTVEHKSREEIFEKKEYWSLICCTGRGSLIYAYSDQLSLFL